MLAVVVWTAHVLTRGFVGSDQFLHVVTGANRSGPAHTRHIASGAIGIN